MSASSDNPRENQVCNRECQFARLFPIALHIAWWRHDFLNDWPLVHRSPMAPLISRHPSKGAVTCAFCPEFAWLVTFFIGNACDESGKQAVADQLSKTATRVRLYAIQCVSLETVRSPQRYVTTLIYDEICPQPLVAHVTGTSYRTLVNHLISL